MRKAYSYIRMSTDTQLKGDSLRRQLEASERFAQDNNLQLVDAIDGVPLKDIGVSAYRGANSKDGVLAMFLGQLQQGKIEPGSVLLIESLDRLSRAQVLDALAQFLTIVTFDIEIITLTDNQRYTKQSLNESPGQLYVSLGIMFRANEESATKSKRLKASWSNKRNHALDKPLTSIAPAWLRYSQELNRFEVIEERVNVVRTIFEMCAYVCGQSSITRYLNENQVPVFGKSQFWNLSYVKKILNNRAVLGEFQPFATVNGKRQPVDDPIPGYFPRIIDDELYNLAQHALKSRATSASGRKGKTYGNLFSGVVYCGACGTRMDYRDRGKQMLSLACRNASHKAGCKAPEWRYQSVEEMLLRHLREVDFRELLGNKSDSVKLEHQLLALKSEVKEREDGFEKLLDLVESESLAEPAKVRMMDRINKASSELADLLQQVEAKQTEINDYNSQLRVFDEDVLKKAIQLIADKKDDYFFRSSVNQLLMRAIAQIDLFVDNDIYAPWEIEPEDIRVQRFLDLHPKLRTLSFDTVVARADFKAFWSQFNKRVRIRYRTGAVRHLLVGHDISFESLPLKKQYKDSQTGQFITEEEANQRSPETIMEVLVRPPAAKKTVR